MPEMPEENVKPGGLTFEVMLKANVPLLMEYLEVVLEDAKTAEKPVIGSGDSPTITALDIEKKLEESENRRKSLEAATLERLAEMEKRAEEVRAKKASMPPAEDTVPETE